MEEEERINFNISLCRKYPFLIPLDYFGNPCTEDPEWNYEFTFRDDVPFGWLHLFDLMCEELRDAIVKTKTYHTFKFVQVKEKFGELRVYTDGGNDDTNRIIDRWSFLSGYVCIECGNPNVRMTTGWISPVCFNCWSKFNSHDYDRYVETTDPVKYPPVLKIIKYRAHSREEVSINMTEDYERLLEDWNKEEYI